MIHFDTNALIALPLWARERREIILRIAAGEPAAASAVVWHEFLIGPVGEGEAELARAFVEDRILPVEAADAALAAGLYNAAGRRRALKTDALIAAIAIRADAALLTVNVDDFEPFVPHGLQLITAGAQPARWR